MKKLIVIILLLIAFPVMWLVGKYTEGYFAVYEMGRSDKE